MGEGEKGRMEEGEKGASRQDRPNPRAPLRRSANAHSRPFEGMALLPRSMELLPDRLVATAWSPHASFTLHSSFLTFHSPFIIPHSSFVIRHSSFVILHSSCTIDHSSFMHRGETHR